jgi:hypothetical protein
MMTSEKDFRRREILYPLHYRRTAISLEEIIIFIDSGILNLRIVFQRLVNMEKKTNYEKKLKVNKS